MSNFLTPALFVFCLNSLWSISYIDWHGNGYGMCKNIKRMNRFGFSILTLAVAAFSGTTVSAQDAEGGKMTLKQCMQYAVDNSYKVLISGAEVSDARVDRLEAILKAFSPSVEAGSYGYYNFGRSVDPETNTYVSVTSFNNGYSLSGGITLFNGFSAVNNIRIARTSVQMGLDKERQTIDQLCLATMEAFYNVVYYKELTSILESQKANAEAALSLVRKQEELGQKGYADVVEMEADLADWNYKYIDASNKLADAYVTLKDLMFWPSQDSLDVDARMVAEGYEDPYGRSFMQENSDIDYTALAELNPAVQIAKNTLRNAGFELKTAKWRFTPSLSFYGGWSTSYYTYPGKEGYVATPFHTQFKNNGGEYLQLSLSFPIYDRLSRVSDLRRKKNAYVRANADYEGKMREVEAEIHRAVQDRNGASAAYLQAQRRADVQEVAWSLNRRKYEEGLVSVLDYQKAADNYLNAKAERLNSLLQFYLKRSVVDYYNGIPYIDQF